MKLIVSYNSSAIFERTGREPEGDISTILDKMKFLKVEKELPSKEFAIISTDLKSLELVQDQLGPDFIAAKPNKYVPL